MENTERNGEQGWRPHRILPTAAAQRTTMTAEMGAGLAELLAAGWPRSPLIHEYDAGRRNRCMWPGCLAWYDRGDGEEVAALGWVGGVLALYHLCGVHAAAGHTPHRRLLPRVGCECGWASDRPSEVLGDMLGRWINHVVEIGAAAS